MCVCVRAWNKIYQKLVTELVSQWEIRGELFFLFFPFQISKIEEIYIYIYYIYIICIYSYIYLIITVVIIQ